MLAKPRRLARDKDFEKVFQQGRSYYSKLLGVKGIANGRAANRYGIIISAKVSKKAVERNKLKRRISQAVKEFDDRLFQGVDLAIVALPALLGHDSEIKNELAMVFTKLGLFRQDK